MSIEFATVEEAVEELRQGRQIVLVDDEDRENEGDLTMAAEKITPEAVNFMAKNGRGLICLALTEERCDDLALRYLIRVARTRHERCPFGQPVLGVMNDRCVDFEELRGCLSAARALATADLRQSTLSLA